MNRTRGFVNLNHFKSGKAIKRLNKISYDKHKKVRGERSPGKGQVKISYIKREESVITSGRSAAR